ncbi:MAG: IS66 family insertion sequence element accessory protein TnpB [Candidatus Brocadiaceae bacterium]|nr:IS66 family insertion sequence element accessory protein TnpB [Candidatus Brocadiaceae bacterium]
MFSLNDRYRYFLYRAPADMRKGFDGLSGLVRNELGMDPLSQDVFIFLNRRRTHMKLLVWEDSGFVVYYKRLERGRFEYPKTDATSGSLSISWRQLMLIIQGIDLQSVRQRKRFSLSKKGKKTA